MRLLLFQVMVDLPDPVPLAEKESSPVASDSNGSYLTQAHNHVTHSNSRRSKHNPTMIVHGPPIIPIELLPPAGPYNYSGTTPRDQFNAWLLLVNSLSNTLEGSASKYLLDRTSDYTEDVGWEEFEAALKLSPVGFTIFPLHNEVLYQAKCLNTWACVLHKPSC